LELVLKKKIFKYFKRFQIIKNLQFVSKLQLLMQFYVPESKYEGDWHAVQEVAFMHVMQLVIFIDVAKLHNTHLLFALSGHTDGSFF